MTSPQVILPQIILYVDTDFGGFHTHLFESNADLSQIFLGGAGSGLPSGASWDNIVSSFVIVSGIWQFFKDPHFGSLQGNPEGLGPGLYSNTQFFGIDNDSLSSVRLIGLTA
jgi:Beta/Gamma crystallin